MRKNLQTLRQQYLDKLKLLQAFSEAQAILSWDRETHMPKGASADRGQTTSVLAGFAHQLFTDQEFIKVVNGLWEAHEELPKMEQRSVYLMKRSLDKACKVSKEFVEETNSIMNAAYTAWVEAKQTNNFPLFLPHLEKVMANRKQYAELLSPNESAYDVLMDDYEEGLKVADLEPVFAELKTGIEKILPKVLKKQSSVKNPLDTQPIPRPQIEAFLREMVQQIGFDFERGAFGAVEHPFQISVSPNDIRLNTSYEAVNHSFTITGMVHELGHGLYEQNVAPALHEWSLGNGVSLGIHESQSRFLENMIGRSTAFWTHFLPLLKTKVPEFAKITVDEVVTALNHVQPSLIRTESDEVTYNLHIILRFELERELINGSLKVADLPEAWKAKMKELLGVEPTTDREGVLQDVHWAWGTVGYFPTYSLGNVGAGQLLVAFEKAHPHWKKEVAAGDFSSYFSWFKEHVWKHGSLLTPAEVMKAATGKSLDAKYLLQYLEKKYF